MSFKKQGFMVIVFIAIIVTGMIYGIVVGLPALNNQMQANAAKAEAEKPEFVVLNVRGLETSCTFEVNRILYLEEVTVVVPEGEGKCIPEGLALLPESYNNVVLKNERLILTTDMGSIEVDEETFEFLEAGVSYTCRNRQNIDILDCQKSK